MMRLLGTVKNKYSLFIRWSKLERTIISFQEPICAFSGTAIFYGFFSFNGLHPWITFTTCCEGRDPICLIHFSAPKVSITHRSYFINTFDWINKLIFLPSSFHLKKSPPYIHSFICIHNTRSHLALFQSSEIPYINKCIS